MNHHGDDHLLGHSNDSLLASADEMAGNYSPHTPTTNSTAVQPTSARSSARNPTSSNGISLVASSVDSDYPMPSEPVVWTQAVHPDSIQRLTSVESEANLETFTDAAKIYSHVNPETFLMPLEARVICMKVDKLGDMHYAIKSGHVTNLRTCNQRLNQIWNERDGQRVFMLFSISGCKEFCALAEVNSGVKVGSMPGWTKPHCEGVIDLTFIYIKDVPFKLVNHIKHKNNRQPVANMWNSMLYHDNTGYHVTKIYIEHPVLSSCLINFRSGMEVSYKSQLRITSSGNTSYSASSFGSNNSKRNDPRSATRPSTHRNRRQWSGTDRRAIQTQPWRQNGRNNLDFTAPASDNSPTPVAPHRQGILRSTPSQPVASPPRFQLTDSTHERASSSARSATSGTSFTTADERLLASFPGFQEAKKAEDARRLQQKRQTNFYPGYGSQNDFPATRGLLHMRDLRRPGLSIDTNWRNPSGNISQQSNMHVGQWQHSGHVQQAAAFTNQPSMGSGATFNNGHAQGMPPPQMPANPTHLPSPANSSENVETAVFSQRQSAPKQPMQGFATPSAQMSQSKGLSGGNLVRSVPQSARAANRDQTPKAFQSSLKGNVKPGSPIKHSQSMPAMIPLEEDGITPKKGSAQRLRAQAVEFDPSRIAGYTSDRFGFSPTVEDWVARTPTRATASSEPLAGKNKAMVPKLDAKFDEDRINILSRQEQHKYHDAQVQVLDVQLSILRAELELDTQDDDEDRRGLLAGIETQHKYHFAKKSILEVQLKTTEREHEEARGDLAQETVDDAPISPSDPVKSSEFSRPSDGFEEKIICPEYDENGKFIRSASKQGDDKPTHMSQVRRHRRGGIVDPNRGGFTGSFDARLRANVEEVLASPPLEHAQPASSQQYPYSNMQQQPNMRFPGSEYIFAPTPQYGSSSDDKCSGNDSSFDNDSSNDVESQIGVADNDDDVFSPRGRFYIRPQQTRDVSQMSYHGGIGLHERFEYK